MKYIGGKYRVRKQIAELINKNRKQNQTYIEPFVGGGNIMREIDISKGQNIAYDIHEGLITMYNAIKEGWIPPMSISELEYQDLKLKNDLTNPLTAFVGFACSFSGKYWGGYARDPKNPTRNYCAEGKQNIEKMRLSIKQFNFECKDYSTIYTVDSIIYCDPPYLGTTKFKGTNSFDYNRFYTWCQKISQHNQVFISEYTMPEDFEAIMALKTKTDMQCRLGKSERIEKVFKYKGGINNE